MTNKDFVTEESSVGYCGSRVSKTVTFLLLPDLFVFVNTDILCLLTKNLHLLYYKSSSILCQNKLPNKSSCKAEEVL